MCRLNRRWYVAAAISLGAVIAVGSCERAHDVDLFSGQGRYEYAILGWPVLQTNRHTAFSERFEIEPGNREMWVRVSSYRPYIWTSPHYRFHNVEYLMQTLVGACEMRGLSTEQRLRLAEELLALLRQGQFPEAGEFVHSLGNSKNVASLPRC